MEQKDIARINELARKAKAEGLTQEEMRERDDLRKAYLATVRKNLVTQLEHTTVVEPDGRVHPLKKKQK